MKADQIVQDLLAEAGITVNGNQPFDMQVHNERLYSLLLGNAQVGLGETYMDGWWDCEALDELITRIVRANLPEKVTQNLRVVARTLTSKIFNRQNRLLSKKLGVSHYNLGNDLFEAMLDKRLTYSCGYWKNVKNLDEAQEAKLDLICRKLNLQPGMTMLDIGCGWGSLAIYAAEKYGVQVTGYNIAEEQVRLARERCKELPVEIRQADYRDVKGQYDAVVSVGFFEHVGHKNYREYMEVTHQSLKDDGVALLHTISNNLTTNYFDPWADKYIFHNAMIPSVARIAKSMEGLFVLEDMENFGPDYDTTLLAWYHNFNMAWPSLQERYGDRFYRMWRYYLLSATGGFRARFNQLTQYVLSKEGRDHPTCRF